ncbi:MAG: hypothetical protein P4L53_19645 [Candidatus Obscuribacterales bacterium]|nr:hypothetical protein [Candidatus Obscuribacterales bacterium]
MPSDEIEDIQTTQEDAAPLNLSPQTAAISCAAAQPIEANNATLYLEQQKFDFESNRIQLILAGILFTIIGFLNFAPYFDVALHEPLVGAITRNNLIYPWTIKALTFSSKYLHHFFDIKAEGPQSGDVVLFCLSAFFVTLISLELTGLNGNRLKATSAIWAGLLFILFPMHANPTVNYIGHIDILASTLYFASVAFFLRYQLLKENMYIIISGLAGLLCLFVQASAWTLLITLAAAYFFVQPVNPNRPIKENTNVASTPPNTAFNWRAISFLFVWLAISFLATGTELNLEYLSISSLSVVFSAPFCLLIANFILPGFYTCDQRKTRALAALGCAILSVMVVLWSLALKVNFNIMTRLPAAHRADY